MIYDHNNKGCPDLKDSVYLAPTSDEPYDPLPMVCFLAERSDQGAYGFETQWPEKYDHKKFKKLDTSYWCTYKLGEIADESWFSDWR
jgi:hypothetical protein